jgi:hypothetical protein
MALLYATMTQRAEPRHKAPAAAAATTAADAAAGGPELTGRAQRESYVRESISRGNRLMAILGSR